jgi:hypothetical protein
MQPSTSGHDSKNALGIGSAKACADSFICRSFHIRIILLRAPVLCALPHITENRGKGQGLHATGREESFAFSTAGRGLSMADALARRKKGQLRSGREQRSWECRARILRGALAA